MTYSMWDLKFFEINTIEILRITMPMNFSYV